MSGPSLFTLLKCRLWLGQGLNTALQHVGMYSYVFCWLVKKAQLNNCFGLCFSKETSTGSKQGHRNSVKYPKWGDHWWRRWRWCWSFLHQGQILWKFHLCWLETALWLLYKHMHVKKFVCFLRYHTPSLRIPDKKRFVRIYN